MVFLPLITRLTRQLSSDDVPDARKEAVRILRERGHVKKRSEELTVAGKKREAMGPAGRAIDRAAKASGRPKSDYVYRSGRALLKSIDNGRGDEPPCIPGRGGKCIICGTADCLRR